MILVIALQLAATVPHQLAPKDSAKLIAQVRDVEFLYIMDWRHEWETWRKDVAVAMQAIRPGTWDTLPVTPAELAERAKVGTIIQARRVGEPCGGIIRYDVDPHDMEMHLVKAGPRGAFCPGWISPFSSESWDVAQGRVDDNGAPIDEAVGIDDPLPDKYRDTVRARRVQVLRLMDSAMVLLPGDGWLAGQSVRMHLDQAEPPQALHVATACRAAAWWCGMLRGYVAFSAHDLRTAEAAFDTALARMPRDTACAWNDLSTLLIYSARKAYQRLSCAEQANVNARIWWLADPLYLVPGNARRAEHYARRVLGILHVGNDADERYDMRTYYSGPALQEMVLRYGWPSAVYWQPPQHCAAPRVCYFVVPPGWSRFDTHDVNLAAGGSPWYWGPRYHTLPDWSAINDPVHAKSTDWDLAPERLDSLYWDTSWWQPELYRREEGPLIELPTQVGFIRRHSTAAVVAAMEWPTTGTFLAPPAHAAVGVITSGGPLETPHIVGVQMDGANPRAILTPIESRPLLLGVEMVPANDSGAAARTRFGVTPPRPLAALEPGTLALSDIMLVRAGPSESYPTSIQDVLPRMYGSTTLMSPKRLAIFWEVYGQRDGDTVDVSLRIVRRSSAGSLARLGAALGIGRTGDDTLTVRWREPRAGDPLAFADSGMSIRPRGFALDASNLTAGTYTLMVEIDRRATSATSAPRELTIVTGSQ
jgi:hypothetical protein